MKNVLRNVMVTALITSVLTALSVGCPVYADSVVAHMDEASLVPEDGRVYQVEGPSMYNVPAYTGEVYVRINGQANTQYTKNHWMQISLDTTVVDADNNGSFVVTDNMGQWTRWALAVTGGSLYGELLMYTGGHQVHAFIRIAANMTPNGPELIDEYPAEDNDFTIQIAH